jgi:hypothetical protein
MEVKMSRTGVSTDTSTRPAEVRTVDMKLEVASFQRRSR